MADSAAASSHLLLELSKTVPDELKAIKPYLQSAHEMRKADPAVSYWCLFYAVQLAINQKSSARSDASTKFLLSLMDTVEEQKRILDDNEIVRADDLVARAYVESVAYNIFNRADTEDRKGAGSKATARGFLATSRLIEVLQNFGALEPEQEKTLKYAKWKAADYSRAFREGRKPTPGPAGGLPEEAEEGQDAEALSGVRDAQGIDAASARMSDLGLPSTAGSEAETGGLINAGLPTTKELEEEMAKLTGQEAQEQDEGPVAISPNIEPPTPERPDPSRNASNTVSPTRSRRAESRLSFDSRAMGNTGSGGGIEGLPFVGSGNHTPSSPSAGSNFNFSMPLHIHRQSSYGSSDEAPRQPETQSAFVQYTQGRIPSGGSGDGMSRSGSPHSQRPLPNPPTPGNGRGGLPVPPGGQGSTLPLAPPSHLSPATTPPMAPQSSLHDSVFLSSQQQQPSSIGGSALPSAPPPFALAPAQTQASAPPASASAGQHIAPDERTMPTSLGLQESARVQKLAKWAVSALDYEDVDTARRHLREALAICEGRTEGASPLSKK